MPSTSKKQHNFMEAIAHNPAFAKKVGVPQSVGQDFSTADKGRKFAKGGDTMAKKMAEGGSAGMNPKMVAMMANKLKMPGVRTPGVRTPTVREPVEAGISPMKKGGMASGGYTKAADGIAQRGKTQGAQPKMFAEGGFVRAADGIAQKGKTKATQIKMAGGGKC